MRSQTIVSMMMITPLLVWALNSAAQVPPTPTSTATPRLLVTARLTKVNGHSTIACTVKDSSGRAVRAQTVSVQKAAAVTGPFADWMSKKTNVNGQGIFPYAQPTYTWYVRCASAVQTTLRAQATLFVSATKTIVGKRPRPSPTATPRPTATATPVPTVTPAPTATPTATPRPTATPTPSVTPTPTPSVTQTPIPISITIGDTTIESTNDYGNGNLLVAQQATLSQTATIQSLSFYVDALGGNLRLGLYADNAGSPGALIASTNEFTPTSTGWNTQSVVSPVSLTAGTYWLAYLPQSSSLGFKLSSIGSGTAVWHNFSYGPMPATFPSGNSGDSFQWSFYATLNTATEATPTPSATPTRTPTPTPQPTVTPTATPMPTATATPRPTATPSPTPTLPQNKQLLQFSDISFVGGFKISGAGWPGDPAFPAGLTHRYVNGALHFFTATWGSPQPVVEFDYPGSSPDPSSFPVASPITNWGDVYGDKLYSGQVIGSIVPRIMGIFWDEVDKRLYWAGGDTYKTNTHQDPTVGYSILNDATGTATPVGQWGFDGRVKMTNSGILPIPSWFADQYLGGQRLAAGIGGCQSVATVGPISMGPTLTAFDPRAMDNAPNWSLIPYTALMGYPFNVTPYTEPDRFHRDTNYTTDYDGWNPLNGVGYFTWSDTFPEMAWVDLPTKHGVFLAMNVSQGHVWYETSTLHAAGDSHQWAIIDPMDLADVAHGVKQQWEVQAKGWKNVEYPGISYPLPGWDNGPYTRIVGVTYDSVGKRLFILIQLAWGTTWPDMGTTVYEYAVH